MSAPIDWAAREKAILKLIRTPPFNGTKSTALHLTYNAHKTPATIESRLRTIAELKLNVGLTNALGRTDPKFTELMERLTGSGYAALTPRQKRSYWQMRDIGFSEEKALRVASEAKSKANVSARLSVISGIKLSPEIYGVEKIPLQYYEMLAHLSPHDIGVALRKKVLIPLENAHSAKILDSAFPYWRRSKMINRRMEPRTILAKIRFLVSKRINPSIKLVRQYSLEWLKANYKSLKQMSAEEQSVLMRRLAEASAIKKPDENAPRKFNSKLLLRAATATEGVYRKISIVYAIRLEVVKLLLEKPNGQATMEEVFGRLRRKRIQCPERTFIDVKSALRQIGIDVSKHKMRINEQWEEQAIAA